MRTEPCIILTYTVPQANAQQALMQYLRNLGRLHIPVFPTDTDERFFVDAEVPASISTLTLHELVMDAEPQADLVGSRRVRGAVAPLHAS